MSTLFYRCIAGALCALVFAAPAAAVEKNDKYLIRDTDTIRTVLEKELNLPVQLVLRSGQELRGTVEHLGTGVVLLSHLVGSDDHDAVVSLDGISAVVFRVRHP
jgi:hypothetical protein